MTIKSSNHKRFVIFSDSLSVLVSLKNGIITNPVIQDLFYQFYELRDRRITVCWIPSHVGIPGNELADRAAKEAISKQIKPSFIPCSDLKHPIQNYVLVIWRDRWNADTHNKLYHTGAQVNTIQPPLYNNREDTVLRRLRLGHTYLTHSHILRGEGQPFCYSCRHPFTVHHILVNCVEYSHIRVKSHSRKVLQSPLCKGAFY